MRRTAGNGPLGEDESGASAESASLFGGVRRTSGVRPRNRGCGDWSGGTNTRTGISTRTGTDSNAGINTRTGINTSTSTSTAGHGSGRQAHAGALLGLDLGVDAAFGAVGTEDPAHGEPEDQPYEDRRGDGEDRIGPKGFWHALSLTRRLSGYP
jgi:hypothetical protein